MKVYEIIKLLAFIILIYTVLPSLYFRYYSPSIKRRFSNIDGIFLTFDDGPNPIYTVEILDLLERYNIKATFFVVARKAEMHRDIIDRIVEEGHTLALHSYSHKSTWLSTPRQTRDDFQRSMLVFQEQDYEVKYFRPPWGMFNLFTHAFSNKNGLQSIFWSTITRDWNPDTTVNNIVHKVMDNIEVGDIIILHDSNHNIDDNLGAPRNTIEALEIILPALIEKGFHFKTIEEGMEVREKVGISI